MYVDQFTFYLHNKIAILKLVFQLKCKFLGVVNAIMWGENATTGENGQRFARLTRCTRSGIITLLLTQLINTTLQVCRRLNLGHVTQYFLCQAQA